MNWWEIVYLVIAGLVVLAIVIGMLAPLILRDMGEL